MKNKILFGLLLLCLAFGLVSCSTVTFTITNAANEAVVIALLDENGNTVKTFEVKSKAESTEVIPGGNALKFTTVKAWVPNYESEANTWPNPNSSAKIYTIIVSQIDSSHKVSTLTINAS